MDNLSSRTALHFAAAGGHVKCVRLLLADAGGDRDGYALSSGGTVEHSH